MILNPDQITRAAKWLDAAGIPNPHAGTPRQFGAAEITAAIGAEFPGGLPAFVAPYAHGPRMHCGCSHTGPRHVAKCVTPYAH